MKTLAVLLGLLFFFNAAAATEIVVCADAGSLEADEKTARVKDCAFSGPGAVQRAVDTAIGGDVILLMPGRHMADGYRDVAFDDLVIRGGTVVKGKPLTLRGLGQVSLESVQRYPASALVVSEGHVHVENVQLRAASPASKEDDVYDGHGIFLVNARVSLFAVDFSGIEKMAISVRGKSSLKARRVKLVAGHVGVWVEESGRVELEDCLIADNDSAAVAAYMQASVRLRNCVLENNQDDGLYAEANADIEAHGALFLRNTPYAARAVDGARIRIADGVFYANASNINSPQHVRLRNIRLFDDVSGPGLGSTP